MTACLGYKMLFLAPRMGKSHFLYISSFVRALLDREHEVTFVTIHSLSHLNLANYTEIRIDPPSNVAPQSKSLNQFDDQISDPCTQYDFWSNLSWNVDWTNDANNIL